MLVCQFLKLVERHIVYKSSLYQYYTMYSTKSAFSRKKRKNKSYHSPNKPHGKQNYKQVREKVKTTMI